MCSYQAFRAKNPCRGNQASVSNRPSQCKSKRRAWLKRTWTGQSGSPIIESCRRLPTAVFITQLLFNLARFRVRCQVMAVSCEGAEGSEDLRASKHISICQPHPRILRQRVRYNTPAPWMTHPLCFRSPPPRFGPRFCFPSLSLSVCILGCLCWVLRSSRGAHVLR